MHFAFYAYIIWCIFCIFCIISPLHIVWFLHGMHFFIPNWMISSLQSQTCWTPTIPIKKMYRPRLPQALSKNLQEVAAHISKNRRLTVWRIHFSPFTTRSGSLSAWCSFDCHALMVLLYLFYRRQVHSKDEEGVKTLRELGEEEDCLPMYRHSYDFLHSPSYTYVIHILHIMHIL